MGDWTPVDFRTADTCDFCFGSRHDDVSAGKPVRRFFRTDEDPGCPMNACEDCLRDPDVLNRPEVVDGDGPAIVGCCE